MKVFVLAPKEDWIVDRFVKEWSEDNSDITVSTPQYADVIWLMADWAWRQIPIDFLRSKKVLTTCHHIVPEKFGINELQDFLARDAITTAYHVPNVHTRDFISPYTKKPIHVISYWANQKIWKKTGTKQELREKHGLPVDAYIVGSFQRDTEGAGISQGIFLPKLEKGPDFLGDAFDHQYAIDKELHVVLAGWRRQYIISRLEHNGIPFSYFEKPSQEVINELYRCLDVYPVTARYEGGPQSLIECGLLGVKCVSRDIGIASQVLPASAINNDVTQATPTVPNIEHLKLPQGYEPYRKLLSEL